MGKVVLNHLQTRFLQIFTEVTCDACRGHLRNGTFFNEVVQFLRMPDDRLAPLGMCNERYVAVHLNLEQQLLRIMGQIRKWEFNENISAAVQCQIFTCFQVLYHLTVYEDFLDGMDSDVNPLFAD